MISNSNLELLDTSEFHEVAFGRISLSIVGTDNSRSTATSLLFVASDRVTDTSRLAALLNGAIGTWEVAAHELRALEFHLALLLHLRHAAAALCTQFSSLRALRAFEAVNTRFAFASAVFLVAVFAQ